MVSLFWRRSCRKTELLRCRLQAGWQVTGFKRSFLRRYPNLKAAQLAWDSACLSGRVGPRSEWGAARAAELAPKQLPPQAPGRRPSQPVEATPRGGGFLHAVQVLPGVDDLPQLYAIRFPSAPVADRKAWFVVIMGACPGAYAGW